MLNKTLFSFVQDSCAELIQKIAALEVIWLITLWLKISPFSNYRAFGIPISLRARDKLRGHSSFERWGLAEQQMLKQKENIKKVSSYKNKTNSSSLQLKLHD